MISNKKDGGQCWDHWYQTRKANLLKITGLLPLDLCAQELTLTSCCRYAESLLANPRILRYLDKHHATELRLLRVLLAQHNEVSMASDQAPNHGLEAIQATIKKKLG